MLRLWYNIIFIEIRRPSEGGGSMAQEQPLSRVENSGESVPRVRKYLEQFVEESVWLLKHVQEVQKKATAIRRKAQQVLAQARQAHQQGNHLNTSGSK